ncbi:glycosyltransferase [Glycomyces tritici]|uniref:Glycosyltransferase n=1 Tax=Glycomyces tritici TaxID=2665176 RepID=A0ABT7YP78_9ACTN|nr:glycosyltransferase [Glycomyces tritici]MDN3240425.1 glycosyltransferase [Glycomyces tritici]
MGQIKVSVIVPVYNAGPMVEEFAPSLLAQTIDGYEILYVDDGSTDDSWERLQRLAAAHDHVRVHTQENSGWPGRPRNVAVRMARGEYVHFVDQDDLLAPDALERLYEFAVASDADVVIGKESGSMVPAGANPGGLFRETRARCGRSEVFEYSLNPHKLYSRRLLLNNDLRFPEGPWILEDQLFNARVCAATDKIAVLADQVYYRWQRRGDSGNNSRAGAQLETYLPNLRTVLEAVAAVGDPMLFVRFYRTEILQFVSGANILEVPWETVQERFAEVRKIAADCLPPGLRAHLAPLDALKARLFEEERLDDLAALARWAPGVSMTAEVDAPRWEDGVLTARAAVALVRPEGGPLRPERRGGVWVVPDVPGVGDWEIDDPGQGFRGDLLAKDRDRDDWWFLPERLAVEPDGGAAAGAVRFDPRSVIGGGPAERGVYDVWARVDLLGLGRRVRLTGGAEPSGAAAEPALVGADSVAVQPFWTSGRQLAVDVGERQRSLSAAVAARPMAVPAAT